MVNRIQIVYLFFQQKGLVIPTSTKEYIIKESKAVYDKRWTEWTIPCDKIDSLPVITLKIGGIDYELTGHEYVDIMGKDLCTLDIHSFASNNHWTLNNKFFEKYCVTFDFGQKRVGISKNIL